MTPIDWILYGLLAVIGGSGLYISWDEERKRLAAEKKREQESMGM